MSSPSLKIKLRLSGPKQPSSQSSSPGLVVKPPTKEETPPTESPRKRARTGGNSRNRRSKPAEGTPGPDTPLTADDDATSITTDEGRRTAGGGNQANVSAMISKKELLKHKDVKVRKWTSKPLVFYTFGGGVVSVPNWHSDEKMTLNDSTTEPITAAEIDQLFSSTAAEKDYRPFLCTQPGCSKAFTSYDQLQTHETNMHGTKNLVCGIDGCHKSFVTSGQLTKHRKMVHFRAARKAKLSAAAADVANNEAKVKDEEEDEDMSTPTTRVTDDTVEM
ncbi:hypothetical protein RO3G_14962 [Rhizopus delemar RA 99-880]|uniref:C2H2-type domain-containing protein n=1 Tax=Rhizopus delemar (strain RA 99-880 / ATCC MYA-4621 / FGSC 9543 / NRRL 43880) TaxID=246409 RepID=I1CP71_RHIO9|nr:hypothetical protein RO3G_14962 [Rhizopus delemar RA 99-880]|eukprot:EIE90251.1 hypothetical protein RO3G_14962 [Rhizopus delemar RA 99-880]